MFDKTVLFLVIAFVIVNQITSSYTVISTVYSGETSLFLRSLRLFGGVLNGAQLEVCVFQNDISLEETKSIENLHANFYKIDEVFHKLANKSIGWRSIICLASIALKYSSHAVSSDTFIYYFNSSLLITNDKILHHLNDNDTVEFGCIPSSNLNMFCDLELLQIQALYGPVLWNTIVSYLDNLKDVRKENRVKLSVHQLLHKFIYSSLLKVTYLPKDLILRTGREWYYGKQTFAVLFDNVNDGKRELLHCPAVGFTCPYSKSAYLELKEDVTGSSTSMCQCQLQLVEPYKLTSLQLLSEVLGPHLRSNQSSCWRLSGCLPITTYTLDSWNSSSLVAHHTSYSVKVAVYDIFPFFDELSLLRVRLELLKDVVTKFILIEAQQTFTGLVKPLFYTLHKDRIIPTALQDQIIHIVIDLPHANCASSRQEAWENERFQRDFAAKLIEPNSPIAKRFHLSFSYSDLILMTDLDELVRPSTVTLLLTYVRIAMEQQRTQKRDSDSSSSSVSEPHLMNRFYKLSMSFFVYNLASPMGDFLTTHPYAATYGHLLDTYYNTSRWETFPSHIRTGECGAPELYFNVIPRAGWHLSNFKSVSRIQYKLEASAHTEFNTDLVKASVSDRVREGRPAEFIMDTVSNAYNAGNVFLQQKARKLYLWEKRDEEFLLLKRLWEDTFADPEQDFPI